MNRRTLLSGAALWSGFLSIAAPVRAAFVSETKPQPSQPCEGTDPYDAIKMVYDGFSRSELTDEFVFDEPHILNGEREYDRVFCKMISSAGVDHQYHNIWLVFNDSDRTFADMRIRTRELVVVQLVSNAVYLATSEENPGAEETLRPSWRRSGGNTIRVKEFLFPQQPTKQDIEISPLFKTTGQGGRISVQMQTLSNFLKLAKL